ncbi:MAG: hypothetical protein ACRD5Z_26525 [Bryobacteraceae bacterium]
MFEFLPPAPAWAIVPGIVISWQPAACPSILLSIGPSPTVVKDGHSFTGATWTNASPFSGLTTTTYTTNLKNSGGLPAGYILSDDKAYKWISPAITVDCVQVQAKPFPGATESIVYAVETYTGTGGTTQSVSPPKPKPKIDYGGVSGESVTATAAPGHAVSFVLDATASTPGDDPGPTLVTYTWSLNGTTIGSGTTLSYSASQSETLTLTVTDEIGHTGSAQVSIDVEYDLPPCPGQIIPDPGGGDCPDANSSVQLGVDGSVIDTPSPAPPGGATWHTICIATDWFQWNPEEQVWDYTDTTVDPNTCHQEFY